MDISEAESDKHCYLNTVKEGKCDPGLISSTSVTYKISNQSIKLNNEY